MPEFHAKLPPSGAHKWVRCALNPMIEEAYPEDEESERAREGTAAHWFAEQTLNGVVDIPDGTVAPNGYPITDEMREGADLLFEDVMKFHRSDLALKTELMVHATAIHDDCWGTLDIGIVDHVERIVRVWDYKFGHRYVDAFRNWQLITYLQGLREKYKYGPDWQYVATVCQPRSYHRDGPIRRWTLDGDELDEYVSALATAARASQEPNPTATTGDHCGDCAGRHACEAFQRSTMNAVDMSLTASHGELPPDALASELRTVLSAESRIKARRDGLEAHASALIRKGQMVPGFALEPKQTREKWKAAPDDVFAFGDAMGTNLRKPPEPITPTQARKALGIDDLVSLGYSEKPRGELSLKMIDEAAVARIFRKA